MNRFIPIFMGLLLGLGGLMFCKIPSARAILINDPYGSGGAGGQAHYPNRFHYLNRGLYSQAPSKPPCKNHGLSRCLMPKKSTGLKPRYHNRLRDKQVHPYLRKIYQYKATQNF